MAKFNLTFRGRILEGHDREQVETRLAELYAIHDPARLRQCFSGDVVVLSRDLNRKEAAESYARLRRLGIETELVKLDDRNGARDGKPPATNSPSEAKASAMEQARQKALAREAAQQAKLEAARLARENVGLRKLASRYVEPVGRSAVMLGLREEAKRIASDPMITCYRDRELQKSAIWQRLMEDISGFRGPGYLTIDMDGFDPALVPGVGTPQPGGLSWFQGVDILEALFANPHIELRGMDVVELARDVHQVSEMTAAKLIQKAMSFWGKAQGYDQRPETGSQIGADYD